MFCERQLRRRVVPGSESSEVLSQGTGYARYDSRCGTATYSETLPAKDGDGQGGSINNGRTDIFNVEAGGQRPVDQL